MNQIIIHSNVPAHGTDTRLVKVPTVVYQIFFDLAQSNYYHNEGSSYGNRTALEEQAMLNMRRMKIFRALKEWVQEAHPDYGIVNFIDLNYNEARDLTRKLREQGHNVFFDWGMYVLLGRGAVADLSYDITNLLPSSKPNLE